MKKKIFVYSVPFSSTHELHLIYISFHSIEIVVKTSTLGALYEKPVLFLL